MTGKIRLAVSADAVTCGRIMFDAFRGIAEQHACRLDFPSVEVATQLADWFIAEPSVFGVVAEIGGRVVGSNFLSKGDPIRGMGPITVDPSDKAASGGGSCKPSSNGQGTRLVCASSKMLSTRVRLRFTPRRGLT
jgi:hypothetical protein